MYQQARIARDPPSFISGDETITRMYGRKATDIRMRASKKNESGILNQNLCSNNDGYKFRKEGDPKGGGYTFANIIYPGRRYTTGSTIREKDMGNLMQLIFSCGDYFRYRDIELVVDSHFGHVTPIAFLRAWGVYVTASFRPSRKGISDIEELSKKALPKEEIKSIFEGDEKENNLNDSDSDEERAVPLEKKKKPRGIKNMLDIFEYKFKKERKGHYMVWKTDLQVAENLKILLFLHCVNDSKVCFRLSTRYAATPSVPLSVTAVVPGNKKKQKLEVQTSAAHRTFRMRMGHNDQSDGKRQRIGLSSSYCKFWPQKPFKKAWEDGIINIYANYLIDPSCPTEKWPEFLYNLVQEMIDNGEDMRKRQKPKFRFKRKHKREEKRKRPITGSDDILKIGLECKGGLHIGSQRWISIPKRTSKCVFCGRQRAMYNCRSCKMYLCGSPPWDKNPFGIKYSKNGPSCYLRFHGISNYPKG